MKVLIIGNGGREHALAWKFSLSKQVKQIFVAPGNAGTQLEDKCKNVPYESNEQILAFAIENKIDLTVVGPELPLVSGIVDLFQQHKMRILGPNQASSQLEGSKIFAKEFMIRNQVATAKYQKFDDPDLAIKFLSDVDFPIVIKADGLASGKGVVIAKTKSEAIEAINDMMVKCIFKDSGKNIVIEEFLEGNEASIICLTDKNNIIPFISSKDHKQIFDKNKGPNTGGMGCICPNKYVSDAVFEDFKKNIMIPTLEGLKKEKLTYSGFLFFGVMITKKGCKLLEYNVRMGDPETQSILPLLQNDIFDIANMSIDNKLDNLELSWKQGYSINVVLASKGYPQKPIVNLPISLANNISAKIFYSGAKIDQDGNLVTSGGRVMSVYANGTTLEGTRNFVYNEIKKINFEGMQYRKDIGISK